MSRSIRSCVRGTPAQVRNMLSRFSTRITWSARKRCLLPLQRRTPSSSSALAILASFTYIGHSRTNGVYVRLPPPARGVADQAIVFVLDLAPNGEMQSRISRLGSLSLACARHYTAQIVDAIEYMHDKDVMHRYVPPIMDYDISIRDTFQRPETGKSSP